MLRNTIILLAIFSLCSQLLYSQLPKHKIGVGCSYMAIDSPDDLVYSPNVLYENQFQKSLFFSSKLGVVLYHGNDVFFNIIPEKRNRINLDFDIKFTILKYKENFLKIGIGPSIWYRNDSIVDRVSFKSEAPDFIPVIIDYNKERRNDINLGYNIISEIEIKPIKRISLIGSFGVASFKKIGFNSMIGVNLQYHLNK